MSRSMSRIAILLEEGEDKSSIKDNAYRSDQIVVKNTQNSEKKSEGQPDINELKTGKVISENTKVPLGKMQSPLIANQDDVRVAPVHLPVVWLSMQDWI